VNPEPSRRLLLPAGRLKSKKSMTSLFWVLLISLSLSSLPAQAFLALPGAGQSRTQDTPPVELSTPEETRAELDRFLAEARAWQAAAPRASVETEAAPQTIQRLRLLDQLVQVRTNSLKFLDEWNAARRQADSPGEDVMLKAFSGAPPYSVFKLDALYSEQESLEEGVQSLDAHIRALDGKKMVLVDKKHRADEALRFRNEALQRSHDAGTKLQLDLDRLRARVVEAELRMTTIEQQMTQARRVLLQARLDASRSVIARVGDAVNFTQADLDQVLATQRASRARLVQERERYAAQSARREAERGHHASAAAEPLPEAGYRLNLLDAALETDRIALEVLAGLETLEDMTADAWQRRYVLLSDSATDHRHEALAALERLRDALLSRKAFARERLEAARTAVREHNLKLQGLSGDELKLRFEPEIQRSLQERVGFLERGEVAAARLERLLLRWIAAASVAQASQPLAERLSNVSRAGGDWLRRIWNYELFAAEDWTQVDGQRVTVSYGVTVGKSVGAVLLFVASYWLVAVLSRRFQRWLVWRFRIDEHASSVARRWLMISLAIVLLIIVLNLARIPLTVFAFLGGALAIGVGFGTQTIIKNFISGLIILVERKIRVGDIVDLGSITGHITAIDMRASTVRGFDGVEALVPNSSFLENQVVNWTYTSPRVRRVLEVGVAYGSELRLVSDLLRQCTDAHPQVLRDPPCEVFLQDFGDNALQFALQYWIELSSGVNAMRVASDLRFAIEDAFREAGIVIPFPQRDLHLDVATLGQVVLTRAETLRPLSRPAD
jgi:potassium-dependent mechanosensitive channel